MNTISDKKQNPYSIKVRALGKYQVSKMPDTNGDTVYYVHRKGYSQVPVFGSFSYDKKEVYKTLRQYHKSS